ncbi:hypothetical protein C5167_011714 [Papaver somniferum]|uniref:Uncharacterized protein n=1 Tax=Papaver somniferum TaxID=3469 RepID=A0A4Y7K7W9_PAPSO|nr:hypothetical protein C5167_011714 [Papaver somniferum]
MHLASEFGGPSSQSSSWASQILPAQEKERKSMKPDLMEMPSLFPKLKTVAESPSSRKPSLISGNSNEKIPNNG